MEPRHPHGPGSTRSDIDRASRLALPPPQQISERFTTAELDQPMPVIGHEHPAQQACVRPVALIRKYRAGKGCRRPVEEDSLTLVGDGGDQVHLAWLKAPAAAQSLVSGRTLLEGHGGILLLALASRYQLVARHEVGKAPDLGGYGVGGASAPTLIPLRSSGLKPLPQNLMPGSGTHPAAFVGAEAPPTKTPCPLRSLMPIGWERLKPLPQTPYD